MLLERESELSCIDDLVMSVGTAGGRVVLVRGEAGIGKTTLIAEVARRHDEDAYFLIGSCDDLLTPQTLGPIGDLAGADPAISLALRDEDTRAIQTTLLDLLSRSLRPTILVIEDSQWADEATLDVIRHVGRRIGRVNGLLVLTYRDTELDLEHPLRQVLGDLPPASVVRLSLSALSTAAVGELIGDREYDVDDVVGQTDGNPLFVRELLATEPGVIPASVHDIVLARVARVPEPARELLDLVSVVPGGAELRLIESISANALDGLEAAEVAGLLTCSGERVTYLHELQRRAVEHALLPVRRRELNQAVLNALKGTEESGRLAHHAREAGDVEALLHFGPIAARLAVGAGSQQVAISHLRSVAPYLERLEPRAAAQILLELATLERETEDARALDHARQAIELLRTIGDPEALSAALVLASDLHSDQLDTGAALGHAQEAVDVLEHEQQSLAYARAMRVLGSMTWMYYEEPPLALPIVDRALELARACGDGPSIVGAMATKGNIEYSIGSSAGIELVEAARALAVEIGDRHLEVNLLQNMAGMYADFRNLAPASDMARRAIETSVRYDMRGVEMVARSVHAEILLWEGRWDEASDAAALALDAPPYTASVAWRVLGTIQARRGGAGARDALDRMWEIAGSAHALSSTDPAAAALAEYLWLSEEEDPSLVGALDDVLAFGLRVGNPWPSGALAFWMWKLGRLDEPPAGSQDFYTWILRGEIDRASEFWAVRGVPYEQALALMHGTESDRLVALRLCEDLGAIPLASRIRADLAAEGVALPRGRSKRTRDHPAGLTARQAEVLDLLAEGLTNVEIAQRLFLSSRTAENHVAAILLKLDVSTRDEAVERAHELDLVERSHSR